MDFLLLLPQGVRVVIEGDGKHRYADATCSATHRWSMPPANSSSPAMEYFASGRWGCSRSQRMQP